ncbi:ComEC/Rec2 family competence protein [Candidatus Bipolaricaulota bacterium]|nr:ComEC/Rec2 family competence protein [Candidatus Bipolaricaulota bacterium]
MERRPLVLIFLSLTAGIILASILEVKTTPLWPIIGTLTCLMALLIAEIFELRIRTGIVIIGVTTLGVALYGANYFEPENLYTQLASIKTVRGKVSSYPVKTQSGTELILEPTEYRGRLKIFLSQDNSYDPNYGDHLTVKGEFQVPPTFNDFDYSEFLRKKKIWGVVYRGEVLEAEKGFANPFLELGWTIRKFLTVRINEVLPKRGNFLRALLFGTRDALDDSTEKSFTKTGLAHLLAASGLHLGIILGASWWLASKLGCGRETTYLISLPLVWGYLIIVGFKLPLLRASVIYLFGGAHLWFKKAGIILDDWYDRYQALAGAALFLVIINPESISTVGFQLSFGATFALALFFRPIQEALPVKPDYLSGIIGASISAQLGVSPVLAVHFGQIHPWAPIINLLAIPGVTAILYLGIVTAIFGQGIAGLSWLGLLTSKSILLFRGGIRKISALPLARVHLPNPTPLSLLSYLILLYWLKQELDKDRAKRPKLREDVN